MLELCSTHLAIHIHLQTAKVKGSDYSLLNIFISYGNGGSGKRSVGKMGLGMRYWTGWRNRNGNDVTEIGETLHGNSWSSRMMAGIDGQRLSNVSRHHVTAKNVVQYVL